MHNWSGKLPPFSTSQIHASGTTVVRPPVLAPPTHDCENFFPESVQTLSSHCPRAASYQGHHRSQYSPSRSTRDNIPHPCSRSRPTYDPLNGGRLSTKSTPRDPPQDPPSWFLNSQNTDPHETTSQPGMHKSRLCYKNLLAYFDIDLGLTIKTLDDLGLPHFDLRYQLPIEFISILGTSPSKLKQPSVASVRIISQDFPWNIDVTKRRDHGNITWKDMLEAVYDGLHKHIEDYEWPLLVLDRDPQYRVDIETNSNTRVNDPDRTPWSNLPEKPDGQSRRKPSKTADWNLKRIDFLGRKTAFLGFKKDKDLEEMRRMPHSKLPISEVWVVELGPSGRRSRCGRGRRIIS